MNRLAKSTWPRRSPIGGMMIPSTIDVTILPNAAPMTRPTARSMALPRAMNWRNSFHMAGSLERTGRLRPDRVQRVMSQDEQRPVIGAAEEQLDRALRDVDPPDAPAVAIVDRSEEHTSELQSRFG